MTYSFDQAGNQVKQPTKGHDDKNQLSQCKELWLFWYGEKPDSIKTLVCAEIENLIGFYPICFFRLVMNLKKLVTAVVHGSLGYHMKQEHSCSKQLII